MCVLPSVGGGAGGPATAGRVTLSPFAAPEIIRQGPPQAACLGLAGCAPVWPSRPQAAYPCAPAAREARDRAATRKAGKALARGVKIAAAHGPRPRGRGRRPAAWRRDAASGAGPLRRAGQAEAEPHQRRQSRRRASAGRLAGAWPARAGGADGPTAPTEWGPGRAGAPTPRPARGRSKARPAAGGPAGAWPCFAEGYPRATAGGWQAPQGRRPEPPQAATSRHRTPTAAGGRGGRRPSRPGWAGVAARRPLGAGGPRPTAGGADGSPRQPAGLASSRLAVSSTKPRGRRVGRAGRGPGREARPQGRAQTEAATRPRPGARAEAPRSAPPRGDPAPRGRKRPGHQAGPSADQSHTGQQVVRS